MLMLGSTSSAIRNLQNSRKITFGHGPLLLPLMVLTPTGKMETVLAFIFVELRALLCSGQPSGVPKVRSCDRRDFNLRVEHTRKNFLFTKLIFQKHHLFNEPTHEIIKARE